VRRPVERAGVAFACRPDRQLLHAMRRVSTEEEDLELALG